MNREELLRRIDHELNRRKWSDRRACLAAGLTQDFIRNLRRHPEWGIKAEKLSALARALGLPPAYFVDETVDRAVIERARVAPVLDRERLRLAQRAADRALEGAHLENFDEVRANLTACVYDSLTERARAGKPVMGPAAEDFIDGLIRGMNVTSSFRDAGFRVRRCRAVSE